MEPKLIKGENFFDYRGKLTFNNDFDVKDVRRLYIIKNIDTEYVRGWKGHRIECRWFTAVHGEFEIKLIKVDNWKSPPKELETETYKLKHEIMDVLFIPANFLYSIKALKENAKLLCMSNFKMGETKDEYQYDIDYFKSD